MIRALLTFLGLSTGALVGAEAATPPALEQCSGVAVVQAEPIPEPLAPLQGGLEQTVGQDDLADPREREDEVASPAPRAGVWWVVLNQQTIAEQGTVLGDSVLVPFGPDVWALTGVVPVRLVVGLDGSDPSADFCP